jgi:hypothetical protein
MKYIDSTANESPGVPPASWIALRCWASGTPSLKVTMYGTGAPVAVVLVVPVVEVVVAPVVVAAVVVVAALVVGAVVVVASDDVGAVVVVAADEVEAIVVVAPVVVDPLVVGAASVVVGALLVEVVPDVEAVAVDDSEIVVEPLVPVAVDVVSLDVELEKVLPIVIGETSPKAPETSRPSAKTPARPTTTRICRRRGMRRLTR